MKTNVEKYKEIAKVYGVAFQKENLKEGYVFEISDNVCIDKTDDGIHTIWVEVNDYCDVYKSVSEVDKLINNLTKAKNILKMLKLYDFKIQE